MRRSSRPWVLALFASLGLWAGPGCGDDPPPVSSCEAGHYAFVRKALLAIDGRRPSSQAEVNVYGDLLISASAQLADSAEARRLVARIMMAEPQFNLRWGDFLMDAMHVTRITATPVESTYEQVQAESCYGEPRAEPIDDGALARFVRDNPASAKAPPLPSFNLGHLLSSALALDDISVVYSAQLFHGLSFPIQGANVEPLALERARRDAFASVFESAYLNRDLTCLTCHNSEFSLTESWPVPGLFERSLFGTSDGASADPMRHRSILRYVDVADIEQGAIAERPWGWAPALCGEYKRPTQDDPLGVDAVFGSVKSTADDPLRGRRASVWALQPAFGRGVSSLVKNGELQMAADGSIPDPDQALAYLVAMSIVERVWEEVVGSGLTIATHFPRTQIQRDILQELTSSFVRSGFSLKTLLQEIVVSPAFNLSAPEDEKCLAEPYSLPTYFNPWSRDEEDPRLHGNSAADGVFAEPSRMVRRALHVAMDWPPPPGFPQGEELALQIATGHFVSEDQPGFRGLDFQGRLSWEDALGGCTAVGSGPDFIDGLADRAAGDHGATIQDAVIALKDRLIGEPFVSASEVSPLETLLGAPLSSPATSIDLEGRLRVLCGAYASSPQFLLGGIVPHERFDVPRLTPADASYDTICEDVAARLKALGTPYRVDCEASAQLIPP